MNFNVNSGISIDTFRNPNAVSCDHNDVGDFLQDVQNEVNSVVSFDYVIEKLEDGGYWQNSGMTSELLE